MSGHPHHSEATHLDTFLSQIATRERSQSRLSVAALTAGCCAAQLEAQCREARLYRMQAPGPCQIEPVISALQLVRGRLRALLEQTLEMESASSMTYLLPDGGFQDRFETQFAMEQMLAEFVVAGVEAASLIAAIGRLARKVHRLRSEVRGGPPSERALLAAASVAVADVLERALRMSRVRDPELRNQALQALARLRALSVVYDLEPLTKERARLN